MTSGSWQHFLPAAYLAGFGDPQPLRRKRKALIWAARRGGDVFRQTAERVGAAKHLYRLEKPSAVARNSNTDVTTPPFPFVPNTDPNVIDSLWSAVEKRLSSAIDSLIFGGGFVDAELWANVLVPFVAHVFVRGPDFGGRFEQRLSSRFGGTNPIPHGKDTLNIARLIEMRRLSGLVMRAEWSVEHAPPGMHFIANDQGRAVFLERGRENRAGYMIPLRRDVALYLVRGTAEYKLHPAKGDKWAVGPISVRQLDRDQVSYINRVIARWARDEFYGWPEPLVRSLHGSMGEAPNPALTEPGLTVVKGEARLYEDLQAQLAEYVSTPPSKASGPFVPTLNTVPAGARTKEKLLQFRLPDSKEAICTLIQSHRLPIDDESQFRDLTGAPIDDERALTAIASMANEAIVKGESVEDLVFVKSPDGMIRRYEPKPGLERVEAWLAGIKRAGCCVFIVGQDEVTRQFAVRHIEWIPLAGPYRIGGPPLVP